MYAWGGTLDDMNDDDFSSGNNAPMSYQNSASGAAVKSRAARTGIEANMMLNADSLVASNTRQ
jgi:hypothetical protein